MASAARHAPRGNARVPRRDHSRARYVEDVLREQMAAGIDQYVILGAGLDSFAQRHPELASQIQIFEIDQPQTQIWKRRRLVELGLALPPSLHFIPVDFEAGESWPEKLAREGFNGSRPALLTSTGVAMYLTKEANVSTLRQIAALAPGTTLVMTFMLPADLVDPVEREMYLRVQERARASGTPFLSFFTPAEMLSLARDAGFKRISHVSRPELVQRYFLNRSDGLQPASGEEFLIATT